MRRLRPPMNDSVAVQENHRQRSNNRQHVEVYKSAFSHLILYPFKGTILTESYPLKTHQRKFAAFNRALPQ